jgi:hypothetical protein
MSHPPITPEERFATIVEALLSHPDVTPHRMDPDRRRGLANLH